MKIYAIALLGLSISGISNAQSETIPGGITHRYLGCAPVNHFVGVRYGLVIETQALSPEYFVRGAFFTETEVYPGAVANYTRIELQSQDHKKAFFGLSNQNKVILNKENFTAIILRGNYVEFNCSEYKID
jgi:hypothetical protein